MFTQHWNIIISEQKRELVMSYDYQISASLTYFEHKNYSYLDFPQHYAIDTPLFRIPT